MRKMVSGGVVQEVGLRPTEESELGEIRLFHLDLDGCSVLLSRDLCGFRRDPEIQAFL
jgi:hypothetical protein